MREGDRGEQTASPVRLGGLVTGSAESLLVSGRLGVRETWRSHDLGHDLKLSKAPRSREGHKPCARPLSQSQLRRPRAVAAVLLGQLDPGPAMLCSGVSGSAVTWRRRSTRVTKPSPDRTERHTPRSSCRRAGLRRRSNDGRSKGRRTRSDECGARPLGGGRLGVLTVPLRPVGTRPQGDSACRMPTRTLHHLPRLLTLCSPAGEPDTTRGGPWTSRVGSGDTA